MQPDSLSFLIFNYRAVATIPRALHISGAPSLNALKYWMFLVQKTFSKMKNPTLYYLLPISQFYIGKIVASF